MLSRVGQSSACLRSLRCGKQSLNLAAMSFCRLMPHLYETKVASINTLKNIGSVADLSRSISCGCAMSTQQTGAICTDNMKPNSSEPVNAVDTEKLPRIVCEGDGKWRAVDFEVSEFFSRHPTGVYTACRTLSDDSVFEFDLHVQRLVSSGTKQLAALRDDSKSTTEASYYEDCFNRLSNYHDTLSKQMYATACDGAKLYRSMGSSSFQHTDIHITFLLSWEPPNTKDTQETRVQQANIGLKSYITTLVDTAPSIQVDIFLGQRNSPTVKDNTWFFERRSLANARTEGSDEVILMEGHVSDWGEYLTEGLSSNFFMVRSDGSLETADSTRVLSGTVRQTVMDVCQKLGVPIHFSCPKLRTLLSSDCEGCFVTSTSRKAKRIHRLIVHHPSDSLHRSLVDFNYSPESLTMRVTSEVALEMARRGTKLCIS
eukprot:GHVQ01014316.1.p1 GENE.GHVQ01014316.1~~GHVQ01014316.1.p1  ORF type:complete len:429 (+),score=34.87 GHVQ01014316.1:269-1555(+)